MIQYSRIGAHACDTLQGEKTTGRPTSNNSEDVFSYFQYRLDEWSRTIKTEFQFKASDERTEKWNRTISTILHLRANNLRIVVSRILLFENGVAETAPVDIWTSSVDVAADTAHILASMDSSPLTCRFQKSRSNYFLIAALGISLLAQLQNSPRPASSSLIKKNIAISPMTYSKAQHSARTCLNLLYSRAEFSTHSRLLWKRVQGIASRLNILDFSGPTDMPNYSDLTSTINIQDIYEEQMNNTVSFDDREPTDVDPSLDMNFSESIQKGQEPISPINMVSSLDIMLDPAFIVDEFGQ